jgi:predicted kinase
MLCGKIASGKSTLAARLGEAPATIVIVQDHWLACLWPGELRSVADYSRVMVRLRAAMEPHVVALLRRGLSVVFDWPANTVASRRWVRGIFEAAAVPHRLHVLDAPDELCLARLRDRNTSGRHEYIVSEAEFAEFTRYFEPPSSAEGFNVVVHPTGDSAGQSPASANIDL